MAPIKDTQEEKSQPDRTILPSCLNLDVFRKEQGHKRDKAPKDNVMLSCTKVTMDEGPGDHEEEPRCPRYSCMSESTLLNCSAINFIQTYHPVQCHKEGEKLLESLKCRAKSDENHGNIDLCCPAEVLAIVTLKEPEEEPRAPEKQQLNAGDHQEAIGDHQTLKTYRDFRSPPGTIRSSQELPTLAYPPPNYTSLFLHTDPDYQCPRLGQESSLGSVFAAGVLGILLFLVFLVVLVGLVVLVVVGVNWWRGRRGQGKERCSSEEPLKVREGPGEERCSSEEPLKVREGPGEGQDGDGDRGTPGT